MKNHAAVDASVSEDQPYSVWERDITECISADLGISYSEAAGIVEGQPFGLAQAWGLDLTARETADKLLTCA